MFARDVAGTVPVRFSSNGDFEIKKFNHAASRSVQGVVLLDGMSVW